MGIAADADCYSASRYRDLPAKISVARHFDDVRTERGHARMCTLTTLLTISNLKLTCLPTA